jgi:hypothetical protein
MLNEREDKLITLKNYQKNNYLSTIAENECDDLGL